MKLKMLLIAGAVVVAQSAVASQGLSYRCEVSRGISGETSCGEVSLSADGGSDNFQDLKNCGVSVQAFPNHLPNGAGMTISMSVDNGSPETTVSTSSDIGILLKNAPSEFILSLGLGGKIREAGMNSFYMTCDLAK